MGDHSRSHSQDLLHILGFGSICRACKSFLSKCYPEKHSLFFRKTGNKTKPKPIEEDSKISRFKNQKSTNRNPDRDNVQEIHDLRHIGHQGSPTGSFRRGSCDDHMTTRSPQWSPLVSTSTGPGPSPPLTRNTSHGRSSFMRSTSRKSQSTMQPAKASLSRAMSQRDASSAAFTCALSRSASRTGSTPILYSNSNGLMKPAAMEQQLDCTLEELCFGCIKKVTITRDAVTDNGQIVEEDEVLTIKVQPGWRKGTKITFEGKGNEMPGTDRADVIFVVAEKQHPLFRRREDDLELGIEIPLVDALTGCTLSVPLLGGRTSLTIEDIVHPAYEKIIAGQGMPKQNEPGTRGNLIITFLVKFPEELTEEQRSNAANILQHTC